MTEESKKYKLTVGYFFVCICTITLPNSLSTSLHSDWVILWPKKEKK